MSGGGPHRAPIEMPPEDNRTPGEKYRSEHGSADKRAKAAKIAKDGGGLRAAVTHHIVTAGLIVMLIGIGTWGYLNFKNVDSPDGSEFSLRAPPFEIPSGHAQLERFRFALDVYARIYEKYPPDLDALVDEGLLASSDLNYPPGSSSILYERVGDSYQLTIERTVAVTEVTDDLNEAQTNGASTAEQTNGAAGDEIEEDP